MAKLLLLFTIVPLCELYLLFLIDRLIGIWPTIGIVLVTGIVGAWLARAQGVRALGQWRKSLVRGQVPEEGVLGGVLILVGGVLLVTPGIMTDIVGFLLLIPPSRRKIRDAIRRRIEKRMADGTIRVVKFTDVKDPADQTYTRESRVGNVVMDVDGEFVDQDDDEDPPPDRRVLH